MLGPGLGRSAGASGRAREGRRTVCLPDCASTKLNGSSFCPEPWLWQKLRTVTATLPGAEPYSCNRVCSSWALRLGTATVHPLVGPRPQAWLPVSCQLRFKQQDCQSSSLAASQLCWGPEKQPRCLTPSSGEGRLLAWKLGWQGERRLGLVQSTEQLKHTRWGLWATEHITQCSVITQSVK